MRIYVVGATLLAAMLSASLAGAEEPADCADMTDRAQMTACYGGLLREAEAAMNRKIVLVKSLKPFLDDATLAEALDESQIAFLEYRKRLCGGVFAFHGESADRNGETLACQLLLDRQRTADLDNFYGVSVP